MAGAYDLQIIVSALDKATGPLKRIGSSVKGQFKTMGQAADQAAWKFGGLSGLVEKVGPDLQRAGMGMATAGAAIVAPLGLAVREGLAFGKGMAEVSTLVDTATVSMDGLETGVRSLATETGESAQVLTKGLYQTISAGVDAAEAVTFLGTAAKAAVGGVTDTATAVDGMTTVMNAWGKSAEDATDIADSMFTAVKAGKTTFGELSAAYAYVAGTASSAGLSIDETNAALAAMTTQGLQTGMAARGLNQALISITQPMDEVRELAASLGIELSETALKEKGLVGIMADLDKATGGSVEQMGELLGSSMAARAGLALVGSGGEKFNATLGMMEKKAGAASEAYDKMAGSGAQAMARMKASVTEVALSIAETLEPIVTGAAEALKPLLDGFAWFVKTPLGKPFILAGAALGGLLLIAGGGIMVVGRLSENWLAMSRLLQAYPAIAETATAATASLNLSLEGLLATLAPIIVAGALLISQWQDLKRVWEGSESVLAKVAQHLKTTFIYSTPVGAGAVIGSKIGGALGLGGTPAASKELEKLGKSAEQASDELAGHSLTTAAAETTDELIRLAGGTDKQKEAAEAAATALEKLAQAAERAPGAGGVGAAPTTAKDKGLIGQALGMLFGKGGMLTGAGKAPGPAPEGKIWEEAKWGLPGFWRTQQINLREYALQNPATFTGASAAGPGGRPGGVTVIVYIDGAEAAQKETAYEVTSEVLGAGAY